MLKLGKVIRIVILLVAVSFVLIGQVVFADDYEPVKSLVDKYHQAGDDNKRIEVIKKFIKTEPKTQEDVDNLRKVFLRKDWDENLFVGSSESMKKIKDPSLDAILIEILKDEKSFVDKASRKDHGNKSEKEVNYRLRNVETIIHKLGEFKSQNAVPVLKEYLSIQGAAYWASQALAKIGDTSASEQIREKAYKGEDVNYGGQGSEEALAVVRDLEDKNKKDQWPKIAKQIIHIKDKKAKPQLKKLFNHDKTYVRWEAAAKFRALADESDVSTIIEMAKNQDHIVRSEAIDAMKKLKNIEFEDELMALLNDGDTFVRTMAAKALGYRRIAKAVPYLEKTINDRELRVREESYIALYILTGKKYEYKGKTVSIEREAERQKAHPSFY